MYVPLFSIGDYTPVAIGIDLCCCGVIGYVILHGGDGVSSLQNETVEFFGCENFSSALDLGNTLSPKRKQPSFNPEICTEIEIAKQKVGRIIRQVTDKSFQL